MVESIQKSVRRHINQVVVSASQDCDPVHNCHVVYSWIVNQLLIMLMWRDFSEHVYAQAKLNFFAVLAEIYKLCHSKNAFPGEAKFFLNNLHMGKIKKIKKVNLRYSVCVTNILKL